MAPRKKTNHLSVVIDRIAADVAEDRAQSFERRIRRFLDDNGHINLSKKELLDRGRIEHSDGDAKAFFFDGLVVCFMPATDLLL